MKDKFTLSASMMCADFGNLEREVHELEDAGVDSFHIDIMDGRYVHNFAMSLYDMAAIARITNKPLDVHLMIVHPEHYISQTAAAGAMMMCVHYEACTHLHRTLQEIHQAGMKAGVALNPATPVGVLEDIVQDADMVLLMSVNPGFGGQCFIENTIAKVKRLRRMLDEQGSSALIEVDGGVQAETAPRLVEAGADVLVSGSYVFRAADPVATIASLKAL